MITLECEPTPISLAPSVALTAGCRGARFPPPAMFPRSWLIAGPYVERSLPSGPAPLAPQQPFEPLGAGQKERPKYPEKSLSDNNS